MMYKLEFGKKFEVKEAQKKSKSLNMTDKPFHPLVGIVFLNIIFCIEKSCKTKVDAF